MCVRMSISTSLLSALLSALRVATCLSYSRGLKARTLSIRRQRGKNRDDMARKQRIEVLDRHHRYPREFILRRNFESRSFYQLLSSVGHRSERAGVNGK